MIPTICHARTQTADGLWATKMGGVFEEGDPSITPFHLEGTADIKELGGHLRIFFRKVIIVRRLFVTTDALKASLLRDFQDQKKKSKREKWVKENPPEEGEDPTVAAQHELSDSDDDLDEDEREEKETKILEVLIEAEKRKPLVLPKLSLFLTSRKPKQRMVDAHTAGTRLRITGQYVEGVFGVLDETRSYECSLTDIPDALSYQGLVVLKLPEEEPVTQEPVIYALVKLLTFRTKSVHSSDALQLTEISEALKRILMDRAEKADEPKKKISRSQKELKEQKEAEAKLAEEGMGGEGEDIKVPASVMELVKPLHEYRRIAAQTWLKFEKSGDEEVDFATFLKFLDFQDIFMVTVQARRIFDAVDLGHDAQMGMSEFENFLIANDILGSAGLDLAVLDVFDSLKSLPVKVLLKLKEQEDKRRREAEEAEEQRKMGLKLVKEKERRLKEGVQAAEGAEKKVEVDPAILAARDKYDKIKQRELAEELEAAQTMARAAGKPIDKKKNQGPEPGIEYSAFNEALQLLGVNEEDDDQIRQAFCFGGGFREKEAETKFLTLSEFRKAWLKIADVGAQMVARGLKPEGGVFADSRNRERLTRGMVGVETVYLSNLRRINAIVDHVKRTRRQHKDQKRHAQEAHREVLLHEARKFMAVRAQENRLKMKKEQEERSKKRIADKVLVNKLQLQQAEKVLQARLAVKGENDKISKLRQEEIRAMGLDVLDLSVTQMRFIPPHLYANQEAQLKLGYIQYADFSRNILESLPEKEFLYWMAECRLLKLSENRLKTLPHEIEQLIHLEVLELDTNRIQSLPTLALSALQRLDLSNNHLMQLPEMGSLHALKYLCVHSNTLTSLPPSVGSCAKIEYMDVSRNKLTELPESTRKLYSLTHLDLSSNRVGALPYHMGDCASLSYLDAATNCITYLPASFGALSALQYCNLENNEIVTSPHIFSHLSSLKYLNMRTNAARELSPDLGNMATLTLLDLSSNRLSALPIEVGMLRHLQELRLHRNQIASLPPELGSCALLQKLEVPYNDLSGCLPDTIGLVTSLVHLDISFNGVDELPRSIVALQQLETINAERCLLTSLPDTITYLSHLRVLNLPNNRFTSFPLELHLVSSLQRLNLRNNSIALLPRNINLLTQLQELDLSRNQLRALPVEFVDVLESVTVQLAHNPWDDLPPRWGKLWPEKHATDGPGGYNLSDAVDVLYGLRTFYDTAEELWEELGVYHYMGRLSFEDFLQELRVRMPKTWHEGLVEYVKHVYFASRRTGAFLRFYALDDATQRDQALRQAADEQRRQQQVAKSRQEVEQRAALLDDIYGGDEVRRARHAWERAQEHEKNEEVKHRMSYQTAKSQAVQKELEAKQRSGRREHTFAKLQNREMIRLQECLEADAEGRGLDRAEQKRKARRPYRLSDLKLK